MPNYSNETEAIRRGARRVTGIDEVGRGPLSGPIVAAAVILDPQAIPDGLRDSKKLSVKRREGLFEIITSTSTFAIGSCSVQEIDNLNILQATFLAMRRAFAGLNTDPDFALIDGNRVPPDFPCPAQPLIGGDDVSVSIAAASIVAKVTRDRIMCDLADKFPGYGWETNAGYGTKQHLDALKLLGVTPQHRVSFKPVHNILYQEN